MKIGKMRFSRPCYDKARRCPGWAGPGWRWPKQDDQCDNGFLRSGVSYDRWSGWKFYRCPACGLVVLPDKVRLVDPTWWKWRVRRRWDDFTYWWRYERRQS